MDRVDASRRSQAIQILYEISASIGTSLDRDQMLRSALSTILRKLSCAAGGVVRVRSSGDAPSIEPIFAKVMELVLDIMRSQEFPGFPAGITALYSEYD